MQSSPLPRASLLGRPAPICASGVWAKGELDPAALENRAIVDLDKAPRNARGLVEYQSDFFILWPADPRRTNGVLVYDVTNRGSKRIFQQLDDSTERPSDPVVVSAGQR